MPKSKTIFRKWLHAIKRLVKVQSQSSNAQSFRFLDLPGEIRNKIYRYLLSTRHANCHDLGSGNLKYELRPAILQASRQINDESMSIFLENRFLLIKTTCAVFEKYFCETNMPVVAFAKTERSTPRDHTSTKISFEVTTQSTISPLDGWVICLKDLETFAVLLFSFYVAYPEDQPKFYLGNNDSIQHESTEKILMQSMLPILAKFKNVPIPQAVNDHIDAVVDQFDFLWNMPYLSCSECLEQAQEIRDAGKEAFDAGDFKLGLERYHAAYFRMYVTADDDVFETRIPQHFAQILEGGVYDDQRGDVVRRELSMQLNLDILKAHLGMQDPETAYHWGMLLIASLEDSDADLHQRLPAGVDETIGFEISDAYLEIADACFYVFEDKQAEKYFGYGLDYLSGRPNFVEEMDRRFQVIHLYPDDLSENSIENWHQRQWALFLDAWYSRRAGLWP